MLAPTGLCVAVLLVAEADEQCSPLRGYALAFLREEGGTRSVTEGARVTLAWRLFSHRWGMFSRGAEKGKGSVRVWHQPFFLCPVLRFPKPFSQALGRGEGRALAKALPSLLHFLFF